MNKGRDFQATKGDYQKDWGIHFSVYNRANCVNIVLMKDCVQVLYKPCVREARYVRLISWTLRCGSEQECSSHMYIKNQSAILILQERSVYLCVDQLNSTGNNQSVHHSIIRSNVLAGTFENYLKLRTWKDMGCRAIHPFFVDILRKIDHAIQLTYLFQYDSKESTSLQNVSEKVLLGK